MIDSAKSVKNIVSTIAAAAIVALTFSACNTVEGAGEDMDSTGRAIERAADKNK
jgi:predicted small secreted protein